MLNRKSLAIASLCLGLVAPVSAAMAEVIGVVGDVAHHPGRIPVGGVQSALASEDEVSPGDLIVTERGGAARLHMADASVITVGPLSHVMLERYAFDPHTNTGDVVTRVEAGGMRFVSGDLSDQSYAIATPVALIGARDSDVTVLVNPETGATRVIVLIGEIVVRPAECDRDIRVRAGRMVDIPPAANCGFDELQAAPLPQWARIIILPVIDTTVEIADNVHGNDRDDGDDPGEPGGSPGVGGGRGGAAIGGGV